jgi:hypothetical protein
MIGRSRVAQRYKNKSWRGIVGGTFLIAIGLIDAFKLSHFAMDWQSMALLLAGSILSFTPLVEMMPRIRKVRMKAFKIVLDEMDLPPDLRKELDGLSAHDIWALDSLAKRVSSNAVADLGAPRRVATRMLLDFGLVTLTGDGLNRQVEVTPRGHKLLAAAASVPL